MLSIDEIRTVENVGTLTRINDFMLAFLISSHSEGTQSSERWMGQYDRKSLKSAVEVTSMFSS